MFKNIKLLAVIGWLLCGLAALPLITTYGNGRPVHATGALFIVLGGPLTLAIASINVLAKFNNPCLFNCENNK